MTIAFSQNGWTANDPSAVSRRMVPGTEVGLTVRNGVAGDVLLEVAAQFDRYVQNIDNARGALDDWGYAERPIRGSATTLSNHASGTAIDLNATQHPLGTDPWKNFSGGEIAAVWKILAATKGVVRWGGDYSGRKDPMHFELNDGTTTADCVRALEALRGQATPSVPSAPSTPKDDVVLDNRTLTGTGGLRLIVPVGRASTSTGRAWLSAVVNGPNAGTVRGWFQSDTAGISDFSWTVGFRDGRSDRAWIEFPDGATQVSLQYSFPNGGTVCLEAMPK